MNNLNGINIIVTAGGTREYIDDVRVMTNISTGALGAKIAETLCLAGASVHYIYGVNSRLPIIDEDVSGKISNYPIKTCNDLLETMKYITINLKPQAVVHCAAVSDFTFVKDTEVKLSSDSAEDFIEYMKQKITRNPKIIQKIKEWNPETILIGFKFTVGQSRDELIKIAYISGIKSNCDAVFANDKSMMNLYKQHVGFLIDIEQFTKNYEDADEVLSTIRGKESIAFNITTYIEDKLSSKNRKF